MLPHKAVVYVYIIYWDVPSTLYIKYITEFILLAIIKTSVTIKGKIYDYIMRLMPCSFL